MHAKQENTEFTDTLDLVQTVVDSVVLQAEAATFFLQNGSSFQESGVVSLRFKKYACSEQ